MCRTGRRRRLCASSSTGTYDEIPEVRERLVAYARQQGLKLKGTCRNIYLEGPPHHKDKSKFVTQVALPLVQDEL